MISKFDVVVIGGGPAGYVAAIRAAQNGLATACIDAWRTPQGEPSLGGTCLNAGCIPSKALLESSELYHRAQHELKNHGIRLGEVGLDLGVMQSRKADIVAQLCGGIRALFRANGVTSFAGRGHLLPGNKVRFTPHEGEPALLESEHVVLATGSTPTALPSIPFDGKQVVDSETALAFDGVPKRLGVIGAGVIGLELGSVWRRLGAEVTILEAMDRFLFMADAQIAREAERQFRRQGLDIHLGATVRSGEAGDAGVRLRYDDRQGSHELVVDKVIVAVGRRPCTEGLLDPLAGVALDERGFIEVDAHCRTSAANVWAVGDVVRGPMLAHKGSEEGVMVADLIAGRYGHVNYGVIPSVIYTAPEIAWVGRTEEELRAAGVQYKAGAFNFAASGRARAMDQAAGLVRILADAQSDVILGVHIVGPMAGELIAEAVVAMEFQATAEDLQRTIHAHPTLAEAIHEAALATDKRALHAVNR
ncbi:MAG: dihydrolipoyl dehydrogenase [Gammaproteobacteria bacterium]|nr:MAG: dihydrolipoyl dehydrogenase [Gammaproteobacteria bacterium]